MYMLLPPFAIVNGNVKNGSDPLLNFEFCAVLIFLPSDCMVHVIENMADLELPGFWCELEES